jgi:hypothetical protein
MMVVSIIETGRRIGGGVGASKLGEHPLDFRNRLQPLVHPLDNPAGLARRQPGNVVGM